LKSLIDIESRKANSLPEKTQAYSLLQQRTQRTVGSSRVRAGWIHPNGKEREPAHVAAAVRPAMTFDEAYNEFKATKAITRLKFTTRRSYATSAKVYLLPRWEKLNVAELAFSSSNGSMPI
jgi:hypothetical protein